MKHAAAYHEKNVYNTPRRNERSQKITVFHAAGTCGKIYSPSLKLIEFFLILSHKYGIEFHSGICVPGYLRHHNPDYGIRTGK